MNNMSTMKFWITAVIVWIACGIISSFIGNMFFDTGCNTYLSSNWDKIIPVIISAVTIIVAIFNPSWQDYRKQRNVTHRSLCILNSRVDSIIKSLIAMHRIFDSRKCPVNKISSNIIDGLTDDLNNLPLNSGRIIELLFVFQGDMNLYQIQYEGMYPFSIDGEIIVEQIDAINCVGNDTTRSGVFESAIALKMEINKIQPMKNIFDCGEIAYIRNSLIREETRQSLDSTCNSST